MSPSVPGFRGRVEDITRAERMRGITEKSCYKSWSCPQGTENTHVHFGFAFYISRAATSQREIRCTALWGPLLYPWPWASRLPGLERYQPRTGFHKTQVRANEHKIIPALPYNSRGLSSLRFCPWSPAQMFIITGQLFRHPTKPL